MTPPLAIHQTVHFQKLLTGMGKAGKNERAARKRAMAIIGWLQTDPVHRKAENRRTHYGEHRLNHYRKYDLACGFRLVGIKRHNLLIFCYIGTHDGCDRWLDNNKHTCKTLESIPLPLQIQHNRNRPQERAGNRISKRPDPYEEQLMEQIDEQMLREIFSGLWPQTTPTP